MQFFLEIRNSVENNCIIQPLGCEAIFNELCIYLNQTTCLAIKSKTDSIISSSYITHASSKKQIISFSAEVSVSKGKYRKVLYTTSCWETITRRTPVLLKAKSKTKSAFKLWLLAMVQCPIGELLMAQQVGPLRVSVRS